MTITAGGRRLWLSAIAAAAAAAAGAGGGGVPSNSIVEMRLRTADNAAVMISDDRSRYVRRSASFPYPPSPAPPAARRLH